jgi:L-threonylcarbamoyladenylate synthase
LTPHAELEGRTESGGPEPSAVEAAVAHLRAGGLLVHPTTGVYGLGGPSQSAADAEVNRLKGRTPETPLLRLVADAGRLAELFPSARWTETAARLAEAFWPGPLTIVLDDGSDDGLALRAEAHPVTAAILRGWGGAVSSTSLNRSGHAPAVDEREARAAISSFAASRRALLFVRAGRLPGPPPSTLLTVRESPPRIVRDGAIGLRAIEAVIGEVSAR